MIPSKLSIPPTPMLKTISEIEEDFYFNTLLHDARKYFSMFPHQFSEEKIEFIFDVDKTISHKLYEKLKREIK